MRVCRDPRFVLIREEILQKERSIHTPVLNIRLESLGHIIGEHRPEYSVET